MNAVIDTSVLIDLVRCSLLNAFILLPLRAHVTDILYEDELEQFFAISRLQRFIEIEEMSALQRNKVDDLYPMFKDLSKPDLSSYLLAFNMGWLLLTGDQNLRKVAEESGVDCHGVLWVLLELFNHRISTPADLHEALSLLRDHPRCWLPMNEVNDLLHLFQSFFLQNSLRD